MANRSYIYASDIVPARGADPKKRRMIGISEWNYDIPVAYKLLASGSPQTAISSIWKLDQKIAIVGDFDAGESRLMQFLDQLPEPQIRSLREEAKLFLSSPQHRRKYFVLECGEIFDMQGGDLALQNDQLLKEIEHFDPPAPQSEKEIDALGLGNWSDVFYFDINDAE
jgi:hypothetical protein